VDWKVYNASERQREPAKNVEQAKELVQKFHDRYPQKPSPSNRSKFKLKQQKNRKENPKNHLVGACVSAGDSETPTALATR
jgi:hypothetical protein